MRDSAVKSVSLSSVCIRYRSMVSIASMRSSVLAGGVCDVLMPALLGVVGCVRAAIVPKAGAGALASAAVVRGHYISTLACRLRRARISCGLALPVICMRAVHMSSQAFMRSAVKPRRSHSSTVTNCTKNSSSAATRSCSASISVGAAPGWGLVGFCTLVAPVCERGL